MTALVAKPSYGQTLTKDDQAADILQIWFDELETQLNMNVLGDRVQLTPYIKAELPSASPAGGWIFVTDDVGGAVPAFCDGTNWRRSTDRAVIS